MALDRGEPFLAVRLLAAADALYESLGVERWPDARQAQDELLASVRELLPPDILDAEWRSARATPLDAIVEEIQKD